MAIVHANEVQPEQPESSRRELRLVTNEYRWPFMNTRALPEGERVFNSERAQSRPTAEWPFPRPTSSGN